MTLHLIKALKYGVATFFTIFLAQWLHLDYAVSAGIIAILTLADTNQQTVHYIGNISLAMVLSLTVASLLFLFPRIYRLGLCPLSFDHLSTGRLDEVGECHCPLCGIGLPLAFGPDRSFSRLDERVSTSHHRDWDRPLG